MGQQSDALNRAGIEPYPDDTETDVTVVEGWGAQPSSALNEPDFAEAYAPGGGTEDETDADLEAQRIQIEQTRAEMSQTIDAIQEKISPANVAQHAKDAVRDATVGKAQDMVGSVTDTAQQMVGSVTDTAQQVVGSVADTATGLVSGAGNTAQDVGSGLWDTIRRNPVPVALAGIGIGWLLVSSRQNGANSRQNRAYTPRQYPYTGESYPYTRTYPYETGTYPYEAGTYARGSRDTGSRLSSYGSQPDSGSGASNGVLDTAGQYASQAQDVASQAATGAQQAAGQMMDSVQNAAGQMVVQVQGAASGMATGAQQGMQQAQSGFQEMMESSPLAVAAGAVALGIAVGLAIPETERENELMGPTRDALVEQAQHTVQQTVQEKVEQVQNVAEQTVGAIKGVANPTSKE